jgi:hypothetical protein
VDFCFLRELLARKSSRAQAARHLKYLWASHIAPIVETICLMKHRAVQLSKALFVSGTRAKQTRELSSLFQAISWFPAP